MDDVKRAAERREVASQRPDPSRSRHSDDALAVFFPLKLLLQPSGPVLEFTRPDMLLGRHSEADVRLPLPDISRRHCRFLFTDSAWEVFDLDSLNGIFINGERVKHAVLRDHDILSISGFRFQVDLSGSTATASDAVSAGEFIHRFPAALPKITPDSESQRKAS